MDQRRRQLSSEHSSIGWTYAQRLEGSESAYRTHVSGVCGASDSRTGQRRRLVYNQREMVGGSVVSTEGSFVDISSPVFCQGQAAQSTTPLHTSESSSSSSSVIGHCDAATDLILRGDETQEFRRRFVQNESTPAFGDRQVIRPVNPGASPFSAHITGEAMHDIIEPAMVGTFGAVHLLTTPAKARASNDFGGHHRDAQRGVRLMHNVGV